MRISDWSSDVCSSDLFGASGFEVIGSVHGEFEVQIEVQSTVTVVGCGGCGTRAVAKDRRWVTVRDAPAGNLAVVVRWRKRIWAGPEAGCAVTTSTEQADLWPRASRVDTLRNGGRPTGATRARAPRRRRPARSGGRG